MSGGFIVAYRGTSKTKDSTSIVVDCAPLDSLAAAPAGDSTTRGRTTDRSQERVPAPSKMLVPADSRR
jgi:hypothetical protein